MGTATGHVEPHREGRTSDLCTRRACDSEGELPWQRVPEAPFRDRELKPYGTRIAGLPGRPQVIADG